jgi:hypothetical protein
MPRMNDRPAASMSFWFASDTMPASATTVTSAKPCAAMNSLITGSMVLVSALFPSNADTISGNPPASVSSPTVICGSSRRSFEKPLSRNPSPASVSKYKVDTSYSTRLAGPRLACAAHVAEIRCRQFCAAKARSRRVTVR